MVIIDSGKEFALFLETIKDAELIVVPIRMDSWSHPAVVTLPAMCYVKTLRSSHEFIFIGDHPEQVFNMMPLPANVFRGAQKIITPSKKALLYLGIDHPHVEDATFVHFLRFGSVPDYNATKPVSLKEIDNKFSTNATYKAVSIFELIYYARSIGNLVEQWTIDWNPSDRHYNTSSLSLFHDTIIPVTYWIERDGIKVDRQEFIHHYSERLYRNPITDDGFVYSDHNPYTTTSRVTNRFGGLNFVAIEKREGTRRAYISRFRNGRMILIDWESFHLRLMAELVGWKFEGSESIHTQLGRVYFGVKELTQEQYDKSKQLSFKYLYGERCTEGENIPFFMEIYRYIDQLWNDIQTTGVVYTPSGRPLYLDRIENPNPGKVFNYMLQMLETEVTFRVMKRLQSIFKDKKSKLVLYTYDSILIDYSLDDGKEFLQSVIRIMEDCGDFGLKYPVRVYSGPNYHDLENVTGLVKSGM